MKKKPSTRLPRKPSRLIRVALDDLRSIEKDPRYKIDMLSWHRPRPNKKCGVCLAGAVMARSLGARFRETTAPKDYSESVCRKLRALEWFRIGGVGAGLDIMGLEMPQGLSTHYYVCHYDRDPKQFYTGVESLAAELEAHGL